MLDISVSFRLRCNVMFNAKESICIAVTKKKLQSKLISRMMMDNIMISSLAWTHSLKYLGINFQANGIIQVV